MIQQPPMWKTLFFYNREDADSRMRGIFIQDTAYFIVIQWSIRSLLHGITMKSRMKVPHVRESASSLISCTILVKMQCRLNCRTGFPDNYNWTGVIYCRVLVKKCPGAYSTQWRYIVHVINFNLGHALYSVTSY